MKYASDYRADARRVLQNNWGLAVVATLVASLLGGSLGLGGGGSSGGSNSNNSDASSQAASGSLSGSGAAVPYWNVFSSVLGQLAATVLAVVAGVLVLYMLIRLVVGGAATLGLARFNLNLFRTGEAQFSDLFSYFCYFGKAFVMNLLRGLYIFLWTLCLIIPGIMATYSYAMTPFLLADHPEWEANEAIGASKQMMYGHRWDYFCMELSFIGWDLLCLFTLGIGYLVLEPYKNAARTSFYEDLMAAQQPPYAQGPYPQAN